MDNMTLTCVRKLRAGTKAARGRKPILLGIPQEHADMLGWCAGDQITIASDKDADTMTLHRVKLEK